MMEFLSIWILPSTMISQQREKFISGTKLILTLLEKTSKNLVQLLYLDIQWILILTCSGQYSSKRLKIQCVRYHQRPVLPGIANHGLTHLLKEIMLSKTTLL